MDATTIKRAACMIDAYENVRNVIAQSRKLLRESPPPHPLSNDVARVVLPGNFTLEVSTDQAFALAEAELETRKAQLAAMGVFV